MGDPLIEAGFGSEAHDDEREPPRELFKEIRAAASAPSPTSRAATIPASVFYTNDKITAAATIHAGTHRVAGVDLSPKAKKKIAAKASRSGRTNRSTRSRRWSRRHEAGEERPDRVGHAESAATPAIRNATPTKARRTARRRGSPMSSPTRLRPTGRAPRGRGRTGRRREHAHGFASRSRPTSTGCSAAR